jgi:hypothetical protein
VGHSPDEVLADSTQKHDSSEIAAK